MRLHRSLDIAAILALAAGALVLCAVAASPATKTVRVFILAGQSNMTGRAPASGLPACGHVIWPVESAGYDYILADTWGGYLGNGDGMVIMMMIMKSPG